MTTFTWDAGDGSSTGDWTTPANWDQGASYPGADPSRSDTAIFPSGKHKCYVNAVSTCATVTINGDAADTVLELQAALEVTGDLTITSGIMDLGATQDLTVGGKTIIGDASHISEDQSTLTCNASLISLGSGKTDDYAVQMLAGGTFAGGIANHTIGSVRQNVANTKFTFTSATTTINSEYTSEDRMFELIAGKVYNADGRITLTGNFTSGIQWNGPSGDTGPHTLRMNDASLTVKPRTALIVEENFNLDAGTFNTSHDYSANNALTVNDSIIIKDGATLTCNASAVSLGNLDMQSGSAWTMSEGTTTVTANGSNATGRTWFTRTNSTDPGPRTLTVPSGSMLMLPNGGTMEFDNSNYFYNITCSGTFDTKNSELHIDNNFRCNGWGPNGYAGYWFTVGNDFTKIGASTFNAIDTGSTWTVSGNMTIEDGTIDVHGRSAPTPGDVNLKLYGNFINNGGYII